MVLLHGLSATGGLNWFTSFDELGRSFRVLALDQRGHGRGIRPRGGRFRLSDCADDVVALADALGVERFIAVGYSMGGPVAQLTWHRHRDRVAGLVLCATARDFTGGQLPRVAAIALPGAALAAHVVPRQLRRNIMGFALSRQFGDSPLARWAAAEIGRNDPAAMLSAATALSRFTSRDWIGEVDVPTAVVITTQDRVVPPPRQRKLAEAIPGATVHEVAGDHGACGYQPRVFVPALVDACRSVARRASLRV